jgi:hypothetical protein
MEWTIQVLFPEGTTFLLLAALSRISLDFNERHASWLLSEM